MIRSRGAAAERGGGHVGGIPTSTEPAFVRLSLDEQFVCVPNRLDGTVSPFAVTDYLEVARVMAGDYPDLMAAVLAPSP